jgi:predicted ferric reductase
VPEGPSEGRAAAAETPLRKHRDLYLWLLLGNALIILTFWWYGSGRSSFGGTIAVINGLGRLAALLGTYLVLWQLLLMSRLPWLHRAFGSQVVVRLHRWNGYLALGLLVAHGALQTLGYEIAAGIGPLQQLWRFIVAYPGLLAAIVALAMLLVVVASTVVIVRRHIAYHTWYFVHLYTYVAIALAFSHEILVGTDFIKDRAFTVYWCALYAAVVVLLLTTRVARPAMLLASHGFRVQEVRHEAEGVFSIHISGRDIGSLGYRAGQFVQLRFLDRRRWWESHPFSLSEAPTGQRLRVTVKALGDHSAALAGVRPGTPVLLEGPFGSLDARSDPDARALLVGGGIGIAPLRALAEEMSGRGTDVCLLYRAQDESELIFRDELDAGARGLTTHYLLDHPDGAPGRWFEPEELRRLVPDAGEREAYICGPRRMMLDVERTLRGIGVARRRIHLEGFSYWQ